MAAPYLEVPEKRINQAKRAQMKRMGGLVPAGSRKRCKKGKSCGAACINGSKVCWVDFPWAMSSSIGQMRDAVKKTTRKTAPYSIEPPTPNTVGNVDYWKVSQIKDLKETAKGILNRLRMEVGAIKTSGVVNEKDVNWRAALGSGVRFVGEGSFGGFATVPPDKLLKKGGGKFPDGVGVKVGNIGPQEVKVLMALKDSDLAPRILGARVSPKVDTDSYGFKSSRGVIAMSKVPGTRLADTGNRINGKRRDDIYWEAVARLHKMGIAHNDMHGGNVFIDSNGKGRFVDLGLAQLSVKAALAEALGFRNGANYQFEASPSYGHGVTASRNLAKVESFLKSKGLDSTDIMTIMKTEIRRPDDFFDQGAWAKISDKDAKKLIDTLYEGIV